MNKEVVLFRSKTGYTFRYAQWISKSLNCDIMENEKLDVMEVMQYDTVILGGGIYAGTVNGLDFLLKNWEKLQEKHLFIFAVGSGEGNSERMEQVWGRQLTSEQRKVIKVFYMRGGFDFAKQTPGNKLLMRIFKFMLKRQKDKTNEINEVLENFHKPVDYSSETNILPLVEAVKKSRK